MSVSMQPPAALSRHERDPQNLSSMNRFPLNNCDVLRDWRFRRSEVAAWTDVELPHTPFTPDIDGGDHWLGICEYRRAIRADRPRMDEHFSLYFHGAMHTCVVLMDGEKAARHEGGYLPFEVDVTRWLRDGQEHELVVELDNRDNPDIPPGKPLAELDFCWYGGLYRDVELRRAAGVHISDAVAAHEVASGGIFVRTLQASANLAEILVSVHLRNVTFLRQTTSLKATIRYGGKIVASQIIPALDIGPMVSAHKDFSILIGSPALWSPASPSLYEVGIELFNASGSVLDARAERFGIRQIEMSRNGGLCINGQHIRPRGTNRHQDHPFAGYALPAAAQRRDAVRIKEAGFDYVRLSHYPQSPDFLDACDELGILVMNCIPGWQNYGGPAFVEACYANARDLVRRDRNHPCIILWELSLNETPMPDEFMAAMHRIGHEEYPGDQMFTCGWIDSSFDVFIHSRQHGRIHTWENGDKALVVAEYGDWEYYAANEGFDQKSGRGLLDPTKNSRAFRGDGERKMLQQAENFATALDDTLSCPAMTDGQWVMFDYPRGYEPERASCGVMDAFRLPKFGYFFYRSQRNPSECGRGWSCGPMVFIASYWTAQSALQIRVFSNCEEVELRLNGRVLGRKQPQRNANTAHLPHPPFVFEVDRFEPGKLEAFGVIGGVVNASHMVATPGEPVRLKAWIDERGVIPGAGEPDLLLVHAAAVDAHGTVATQSAALVTLCAIDGAEIAGPAQAAAEAGIASFVVRKHAGTKGIRITVEAEGLSRARADTPSLS